MALLFRFTLITIDGPQVLLGHATSNVMTDYLDRYMPTMKADDKVIVEAVERPKSKHPLGDSMDFTEEPWESQRSALAKYLEGLPEDYDQRLSMKIPPISKVD